MVCIYCASKTKIINSRFQRKLNSTWRRHRCNRCSAVFTTTEVPKLDSLWLIKRPNGKVSAFSSNRLLLSLYHSLKHRKNALDEASALTLTVISKIKPVKKSEIDINTIRNTVYGILKRFDKVAAVHYKAYYF